MTDSVLLRHTECPCGTSSDALAIYDDGHGFCFSCDKHFAAKALREKGYDVEAEDVPGDNEAWGGSGDRVGLLPGKPLALAKRRITEESAKKWGYVSVEFGGRPVQCANIYDNNRKLVAQKLRLPNKDFIWRGDKKEAPGLYGIWLWQSGGKKVVITEGELDAITVSQLQDHKWPVVSVMNGAAGAVKSIKKHLDWLNTFDQVILMFDNDEAGQAAVEKCVTLFPPGKVAVASLPLKDASDMLQAGRGKEVIDAIWRAREWRPDGIVNAADLWDTFISEDAPGFPYPWESLNTKTLGLRRRELVTLTAGSGIGKSTACREVAHWLLSNGEKVGYIALEESNRKTLQELVGIQLNRRLLKVPKEGPEAIPEEDLKTAFQAVAGSGNLFLYDHFGSLNSERLLGHIRFMAVSMGVSWVILDHLSIVVSGDDTLTDERRGIDLAMTKLRSLVEETGIGLILVSHLKRPDGKGHEEGAPTSLAQLRGSAAIAQLSDMVLGLERNQQDTTNANQVGIRILKNRYTGETGVATLLEYDDETGRLQEAAPFDDEEDDEEGPRDY